MPTQEAHLSHIQLASARQVRFAMQNDTLVQACQTENTVRAAS